MTFTVIPVPAMGAEDVVVAPRPDEGASSPAPRTAASGGSATTAGSVDRVADTGGRPLGIEIARRRPAAGLRRRTGACSASTPATGAVEALARPASTAQPMLFCNNAAVAADGTIWFSDSSPHSASRSGRRLRPGHPHRPAAPARPRRHHHGRPRRAGLRQRRRAGRRRVVRRGRRDAARAPSSATGSPARGRAARPARRATCPATPTTSPGAATA